MADCRHVFHAACIKTLLRSQSSSWLAGDFSVSCPLCRGPLVAASIEHVPRRERRRAITLSSAWFATGASTSITTEDEEASLASAVVPTGREDPTGAVQTHRAQLRRAGTAPVGESDNQRPVLLQRAASSHL